MSNTLADPANPSPKDWELLAKRLIVCMDKGIRIEQESGHRWIVEHSDADRCAHILDDKTQGTAENWDNMKNKKHYGSYTDALDFIDARLAEKKHESLVETFDRGIDYFDDLSNIFGEGTQ
jgi:hypothetical protein